MNRRDFLRATVAAMLVPPALTLLPPVFATGGVVDENDPAVRDACLRLRPGWAWPVPAAASRAFAIDRAIRLTGAVTRTAERLREHMQGSPRDFVGGHRIAIEGAIEVSRISREAPTWKA